MVDVAAERAAVTKEAMEWEGTPFQHKQCLKHVGADCLTLIHAAFSILPLQKVEIPDYAPDEFLHQGEERYAAGLAQWFDSLGMDEAPLPGDAVSFRFGRRMVAHIGIVVNEDWFISALFDRGRTELNRLSEAYWRTRYTGVWRLRRWVILPE